MQIEWQEVLRYFMVSVISFSWSALILDSTFGRVRKSKKAAAAGYCLAAAGLLAVVPALEIFIQWYYFQTDLIDASSWLRNFRTIGQILLNTVEMLTSMVAVVFYARMVYRTKDAARLFTAVLAELAAMVSDSFLAPMLSIPFMEYTDTAPAEELSVAGYLAVRILCLTVLYVLYRRFVKKYVTALVENAEAGLDSFVKVPVLSCIVFAFLLCLFVVTGIHYTSQYSPNRIVWILLFGLLALVYIMMYWGIFRAVMLATQSMRTKAELGIAGRIQMSVLPLENSLGAEDKRFSVYGHMEPAKEVGGDFYDFFPVGENKIGLIIADVSGKGIPAALFMMSARTILRNQNYAEEGPGEILEKVNNQLNKGNDTGMFVTAFLGILELSTGKLVYSNAGHNPPYTVSREGKVTKIPTDHGFVLAVMEDIQYTQQKLWLRPGEKLVLYTDGVTEAANEEKEFFGETAFEKVLETIYSQTVEESGKQISGVLKEFAQRAEQADDITLLLLEYTGNEGTGED